MYIPASGSSVWAAISGGYELPTLCQIYQSGDDVFIKGADAAGDDLFIHTNQVDSYPLIEMSGNGGIKIKAASSETIEFKGATVLGFKMEMYNPNFQIKETSNSPTNDAGYGQLYTKADNHLYFMDGDGTEYTVNKT